jgi:hypothetical protein
MLLREEAGKKVDGAFIELSRVLCQQINSKQNFSSSVGFVKGVTSVIVLLSH